MLAFRRWGLRRSFTSKLTFRRLHRSCPWKLRRSGLAGAWPSMRAAYYYPDLSVRAFATCVTTMPSADFCRAVKAPCDAFSHESGTHGRSPEVSSTAFRAQPPNLQPAPLMDMDFAVIARSSGAVCLISGSCPSARVFAPRFFQTPPRDDALALRYHFSSIRM